MSARFVNIDHDTPMLLPPDLRDWVSPGHMVHFVMEAVVALDLSLAHTNERGTGSAQYPPSMMLGLLIYCYATGTFSSRRIETLTYENVAVSKEAVKRSQAFWLFNESHSAVSNENHSAVSGGGTENCTRWRVRSTQKISSDIAVISATKTRFRTKPTRIMVR